MINGGEEDGAVGGERDFVSGVLNRLFHLFINLVSRYADWVYFVREGGDPGVFGATVNRRHVSEEPWFFCFFDKRAVRIIGGGSWFALSFFLSGVEGILRPYFRLMGH